jgi:hypothetical protein
MDEALLAEDLAIRYADFQRGHRSGRFAGNDIYQQTREECMAILFGAVANHHGVTDAQVREARVYRRASIDLLVILAFVVFYLAVADRVIGWLFRGIPVDAPWRRCVAATITAWGVGTGGLLLFGVYFGTVEMVRIGNTHMSYRALRGPWNDRQPELLIAAVILFALLASYRHASARWESRESAATDHAT